MPETVLSSGRIKNRVCRAALSILVFVSFLAAACPSACCQSYSLPEIPDSLTAPEERAEYLCLHWWDGFDFADTTLISRPGVTEQAFVDFLSVLPYIADASAPLDTMFRRANADPAMFSHFVSLGEKYLAGRWSPMRDEDLYVVMLRVLASGDTFPAGERGLARFRLEMALKNRPGEPAADFGFELADGSRDSLYGIDAEYLIVFFNDPGCVECRSLRSELASSPELGGLLASGRVKLLSLNVAGGSFDAGSPSGWLDACDRGRTVYSGALYDLQSLPVLYLLSSDKHVLLKDTSLEDILDCLSADGDIATGIQLSSASTPIYSVR